MSTVDNTIVVQTEDKNLLRDTNSKGLLFNNKAELQKYQSRKNFMASIKQEKMQENSRIQKLENEMSEIKNLLLQLIEKEK